jgi:hypothetical protein
MLAIYMAWEYYGIYSGPLAARSFYDFRQSFIKDGGERKQEMMSIWMNSDSDF